MYAPKLRDMTADERWAEGFAYRIDAMAHCISEEIAAMAHKARKELGLIEAVTLPESPLAALSGDELSKMARLQSLGMLNSYPNYAIQQMKSNAIPYSMGMTSAAFGGSPLVNPFGWI